jgi:HlyD family secretion protein
MRDALLVVLASIVLAGCNGGSADGPILASGHVEATEVRLATKIAGRVESLALEEGDVVKQGAELARIETSDQKLQLEQLRAERSQADADYRLRRAGYREEDKAELRAQRDALVADLVAAQKDFDRMQGLFDRGSGTAKSLDDARGRRDQLAARLAAADQSLRRAESGYRPQEIDSAKAKLDGVDARIAFLERQIADATVLSPLDAMVTEKLAEPGEWLQVGGAIAVLTNLREPWLTVYVGGEDLPRVKLGDPASVVTDDGTKREGRITYVSSTAEFTPKNVQTRKEREKLVYKVKIALDNADGLFKPGMPAEARLAAGNR